MSSEIGLVSVVNNQICSGCGACIIICPKSALKLTLDNSKGIFLPVLDKNLCINCSLCCDVCPSIQSDLNGFNEFCYTEELNNFLIGRYLNCFTGYSTDVSVRYTSSAGGLVTQLLSFALDSGIIDGALVTRMSQTDPFRPEPFIATTKEEIISASKSKYCPVPLNLALNEILRKDGHFAVVGLPCQIKAIRKAEQINKTLKKRIILHLGLFCSHTPTFLATDFFLHRINIKKKDVSKLDYRGEGWPGFMKVTLKNGCVIKVPETSYWAFLGKDFFIPRHCLLCNDALNEFADISFGDAWLSEFLNDSIGTSIMVSRSYVGKRLLENAQSKGEININIIPTKKVIESQLNVLYLKKKNITPRINFFRKKIIYPRNLNLDILDYVIALHICLNNYLLQMYPFKFLLKKVPMRLFYIYYYIPNMLRLKALSNFRKVVMQ